MSVCNNCNDILHNIIGYTHVKPHVLSGLLVLNILLLLFSYWKTFLTNVAMSHLVITGIVLFVFRYLMSLVTYCKMDTTPQHKSPHDWHMIVRRVMVSLLITLILVSSVTVPTVVKSLSIILTIVIIILEISTRNHYTSDVIITLVLTFLCTQAFRNIIK